MKTDTQEMANTLPQRWGRCFRQRRYLLIVSVVCICVFVVIGCASTAAALWNIDDSFPHPAQSALLFAAFWSGFTLLGVWLLVSYLRHRLYVSDSTITRIGVFGQSTVAIPDIRRANWRLFPGGGSLVVRTVTAKIKIYFGDYEPHDARQIISLLREQIDQTAQDGWPRFESVKLKKSPERGRNSRRVEFVATLALTGFVVLFVCCWLAGMGRRFLVFALGNAIVAAWSGFRFLRSPRDTGKSPAQSGSGDNTAG